MASTNSHARAIAKNASVVAGATLVSRILGFVRDLVIAFALGAGPLADAFFVAFRLPNLLRRLFGEGSLTMAFVPVFTRTRAEGGDAPAFAMARSALVWLLLILGAVCVLGVVFARPLTIAIAPGFADDPELLATTVNLVRICFPYALFICSVALCMGILNSLGSFLAPALAPCVLNVVLISGALGAVLLDGDVPVVLAWSVLAAGLLQWALQQPFLAKKGFAWRGEWRLADPGVKRMGKVMLPTVFGAAVYQLNILLGTLLASFLAAGSISYLYYADRLVQFPLGVFGVAVSTAALPSLSALAAEEDEAGFAEALNGSLRLTLFISLPAAAGLIALAEPVVALLFQRGAFSAGAVHSTATALVAYAAGLPAFAVVRPLVSAFYARQDTRTPVLVATVCLVLYVAVGAGLMQIMGHVGLALAVSVSSWCNALLLGFLLARGMRATAPPRLWRHTVRPSLLFAVLGAGVGLAAWGAWVLAPPALASATLALIPLWAVAYVFAAQACGAEDAQLFREALARILRRMRKKSSSIPS